MLILNVISFKEKSAKITKEKKNHRKSFINNLRTIDPCYLL